MDRHRAAHGRFQREGAREVIVASARFNFCLAAGVALGDSDLETLPGGETVQQFGIAGGETPAAQLGVGDEEPIERVARPT